MEYSRLFLNIMGPLCLSVSIYLTCLSFLVYGAVKYPLIYVPDFGNSILQVKLTSTQKQCVDLERNIWHDFWLSPRFVDSHPSCLISLMTLKYDKRRHITKNQDGVKIKVRGWGRTNNIARWNSNKTSPKAMLPKFEYLEPVFNFLTNRKYRMGYKDGQSLRGVPYDYRKASNEMHMFGYRMKMLIERTYRTNDNKKLVILSFSHGSLVALHFLNSMTSEWKNKYIEAYIAIGGTFGGSVDTLQSLISGPYIFSGSNVQRSVIKKAYLSWPALYWGLPSTVLWSKTEQLVKTPNRAYTSHDYRQLLADITNSSDTFQLLDDTGYKSPLPNAPKVKVYCLYGTGVPTSDSITYETMDNFPDNPKSQKSRDSGDGAVSIKSMSVCKGWTNKQTEPVVVKEFNRFSHEDMIQHSNIFEQLRVILRPDTVGQKLYLHSDAMPNNVGKFKHVLTFVVMFVLSFYMFSTIY